MIIRNPVRRLCGMLSLGLALALASPAVAEVAPAKPYAQIVSEVMGFLVSDVGWNGIRTNDNAPDGYPVPPYFYSYAINDGNNLDGNLNGYPGYLSVSYPAYTACVAIDAFLDWRRWSGDPEGLARARAYADWILEHRTPAGDLYGNLPYSTQTDGVMGGGWDGLAIMTDKPPMFGLRLLRLYDITGDISYWNGAVEIADVMAATQLTGDVADDGRWPFRVVPLDGTVTQDYTSHLMPAVRFFDGMATRTGNPIYAQSRDRAWAWLLANPCEPTSPSYMRWEAFYEDQTPAMQTGFGDHYSGHEMIVELVARQPVGWEDLAITVLDSLSARFLQKGASSSYAPFEPVTLEWFGWPEGTYASSLQYARTALLLHQALAGDARQNDTWRTDALAMAAACSHGQNNRGDAADGRMFTTIRDLLYFFNVDSWYEQDFNTVIYFLELMNLDPSLAPLNEVHILDADEALTQIGFSLDGPMILYATASGSGTERLKLAGPPGYIFADGAILPELGSLPAGNPGWFWDEATGVVTIHHETGPVAVTHIPAAVPGTDPRSASVLQLRASGSSIDVNLARDGELSLAVYDLRGRLVRNLISTESWSAGTRKIVWDGRDNNGRVAASGVYLVRGHSGQAVARTRVVQVR
ncbi:MAG: FlgD immunoglobulin-like domain containing protein [Candidatus Krumholzibacteria bacterium]|nr:FlgD immunoglobulin-like domain containing protein [Candidatus Krumholzibacteria bacterium]